ncbi:helix-turn-helix domain-containing protein [Streptomyces sp. NPDC059076]|uniref:helix-turn-helix domain-containing protein n=1 Tax=unclassified Streptomyces TaxID=2593676 RepID=UPI0036BF82C3
MTANQDSTSAEVTAWGPISRQIARNLPDLRKARNLSTTRLSAKLKETGRPIPPTGITRIEKGERRVDVDDLVALAHALNVSPAALLLPDDFDDETRTFLTDRVRVSSRTAWRWFEGDAPSVDAPAPGKRDDDYWQKRENHQALSSPTERRRFTQSPLGRALADVSEAAELLHASSDGAMVSGGDELFDARLTRAKDAAERFLGAVDRVAAERVELAHALEAIESPKSKGSDE